MVPKEFTVFVVLKTGNGILPGFITISVGGLSFVALRHDMLPTAGQHILVGCDMYTPLGLYAKSVITKSISPCGLLVNQNLVSQEP